MPTFKILTEPTPHAHKTMIYGLAGVGKTTLASQLDSPLFIDMEGGCSTLNVARTPTISYYAAAKKVIDEIAANPKEYAAYKTIVIDSIDWLCRKAEEHASGVVSVVDGQLVEDMSATIGKANGGYGNGGKQLENHVRAELFPRLDKLVAAGFAVCLIAHADQKDLMDAEGFRVSKISPAIAERVMEPIVQWCDNVFYLKNVGGKRTLLLEGTDTVLAKNRLHKTGEVGLEKATIKEIVTPNEDN